MASISSILSPNLLQQQPGKLFSTHQPQPLQGLSQISSLSPSNFPPPLCLALPFGRSGTIPKDLCCRPRSSCIDGAGPVVGCGAEAVRWKHSADCRQRWATPHCRGAWRRGEGGGNVSMGLNISWLGWSYVWMNELKIQSDEVSEDWFCSWIEIPQPQEKCGESSEVMRTRLVVVLIYFFLV